jgi:hypothetical protein
MMRLRFLLNKAAISGAGFLLAVLPLPAQKLDFKNQVSAWFSLNDARPSTPRFGLRYIPSLSLIKAIGNNLSVDGEVSANAYGLGQASGWKDISADGRIKPYRLWLRLSTPRFEARLGIQKINFGSAAILRPLMWFDRIDPRDPLQITDGVSALLVRYYFPGNANVWAWGLYGNEDLKGWESSPTARRSPEFGGRVQIPLFHGELGLTYHHRRADLSRGLVYESVLQDPVVPEDRFAVDGKWDIGIGIWAEGVLIQQHHQALSCPYQRQLGIGADYTFAIGNGLHLLAEHLVQRGASSAWGKGTGADFTALSLNYPLGLLDGLSGIFFYDWKNRDSFNFLSWRRTYDHWQFFVIGFWNPEGGRIIQAAQGNNFFGGKGFQIMAVLNY